MPHQGTTVAGPRPPCSGWTRAGPVVESQPPFVRIECLRKKLQPPTDRIPTSSASPGPAVVILPDSRGRPSNAHASTPEHRFRDHSEAVQK